MHSARYRELKPHFPEACSIRQACTIVSHAQLAQTTCPKCCPQCPIWNPGCITANVIEAPRPSHLGVSPGVREIVSFRIFFESNAL